MQHLTSSLTTCDTEKRTMLDNLTKVYKLVEKLETKATHKIEELSGNSTERSPCALGIQPPGAGLLEHKGLGS